MQISEHIHSLRIPFTIPVSSEKIIDRYVYSYVVLGKAITLIDSGVQGAESLIFEYIKKNGRDSKEISTLILSHSHPDHIGSAKKIKEVTGCAIAAHANEKSWIESTEKQFQERPVPGFHTLVGGPVSVDRELVDNEMIKFDDQLEFQVLHTPGHSSGSVSLLFKQEKVLFTADALPQPNDLPIYEDITVSLKSIINLKNLEGIEYLLSSWEAPIQGTNNIKKRINDGVAYLKRIHEAVLKVQNQGIVDKMGLCRKVVENLGLPTFAANPLIARAFGSSLNASEADKLFGQLA